MTLEQVHEMMQQVPAYESRKWKGEDPYAPDFGVVATTRPNTALSEGRHMKTQSVVEMI